MCAQGGLCGVYTSGLHVEAPTSQDLTSAHLLDV